MQKRQREGETGREGVKRERQGRRERKGEIERERESLRHVEDSWFSQFSYCIEALAHFMCK